MITIVLKKESIGYSNNIYVPQTSADKHLMQHCVNEDLDSLNEEGLSKAHYIAAAHEWRIEVI